jgi:heavy metal efflux system protein
MIERILTFSVRQRWFVVLLTAMAAGWGVWSLVRLPIDAVPDITNNQVQINTVATALSPSEIEKQVTLPVETALAGIPGLEYTRSLSRNGFSQVTAVFSDRTDIYFARQQVGERLTEVRSTLPPGIEPRMGPITTGLGEIYMWLVQYLPAKERGTFRDGQPGWQSDGSYLTPEGQRLRNDLERVTYLRTVQDWIIRPQLRHVSGVAGIDAIGGYVKQYHVQPDPARLNAFDISFGELAEAIERNNTSRGGGYVDRFGEGHIVRTGGRIENMQEIGEIVVSTRHGIPVRVRDVATVAIGGELRSGSASQDGREVVAGTALMRTGANSRAVSAAVGAKLRDINRTLPPGIEATTVLDRTVLVDATIRTVATNLAEGALLVVLVLFVLLGNFRAAMITALVIPLAMLLTATGMLQGRLSANLMSLGALDFGLIVDGAVIIGENCLRRIAERQHGLGRRLEPTSASQP